MQKQHKNTMRKVLGAAVVSACMGLGATGAQAGHIAGFSFTETPFLINPAAVGVGEPACVGACTASFIDFSYQGEVDQTNTGVASATFTETGAGFFGTFRTSLGGAPVLGTGLGVNYQLYLLFNGAGSIVAGSGGTGIDGTFSSFNFSIWVDKNLDTTFTTVATGGVNETKAVAAGGGEDVQVLSGTLVPGSGGFHVFGGLVNGDFDVRLNVTPITGFFSGAAFANPGTQADLNGVNTSILGVGVPFATTTDIVINGSGNVAFAAKVPEPASLGLLGIGLLGLVAGLRKRQSKSVA